MNNPEDPERNDKIANIAKKLNHFNPDGPRVKTIKDVVNEIVSIGSIPEVYAHHDDQYGLIFLKPEFVQINLKSKKYNCSEFREELTLLVDAAEPVLKTYSELMNRALNPD